MNGEKTNCMPPQIVANSTSSSVARVVSPPAKDSRIVGSTWTTIPSARTSRVTVQKMKASARWFVMVAWVSTPS